MVGSGFKVLGLALVASLGVLLVACGGASQEQDSATILPTVGPQTASSTSASPPASCTSLESALVPENGIYFGVNLDWEHDSPANYAERLGHAPAVYVLFQEFPLNVEALGYVHHIAEQVKAEGGMLMLTLEPLSGLDSVNRESADQLASQLAGVNAKGVPIFLRFAHEMNGSWYAWSQQPSEYIRAFREIAAAVHEEAPQTAMVWAPNYGGGYPFKG